MTTRPAAARVQVWVPVVAPAISALHFTITYVTIAVVCGRRAPSPAAVSVGPLVAAYTVVAVLAMGVILVRALRRHRLEPFAAHDADTAEDRQRFMNTTTVLLAALSLLATTYIALAFVMVHRCA